MVQNFSRIAGVVQAVLGVLGTAIPDLSAVLGTQLGGNIFNIISGAALSYLGFKGTEANQRTGAQVLGGLNGVVGLLGAFGVTNLVGIPLSEGVVSTIINLAIGAWGLYAGFAKKAAAN